VGCLVNFEYSVLILIQSTIRELRELPNQQSRSIILIYLRAEFIRMQPTTLVLIRHAHAGDPNGGGPGLMCGWHDAPLSPLGRAQVEQLRARLAAEEPPSALYVSALKRAQQTAQAVPAGLRLRARLLGALREIYCGQFEGLPLAEVQSQYPELWQRHLAQTDEHFRWPGGESYCGFRSRVLSTLRRIAAAYPGQRVWVITHAGVVSQLLGAFYGISAARWEVFRPGNASITEVSWDGEAGTLVRFDDRTHLELRDDG
jgi:broad specificity phosphatase PhoE